MQAAPATAGPFLLTLNLMGVFSMNKLCLSAACAALLASPVAVWAQSAYEGDTATLSDFDNRWYVVPFATYTWADEDRGTDDGVGFGFAVGKPITNWFNLELRGTFTNLVSEDADDLRDLSDDELRDRFNTFLDRGYQGQGDFEVGDIAIDGLFFFNRSGVRPYLLAGLGAINDNFDCDRTYTNAVGGCESGDSWSFMAEAGAGVVVPITQNIAFRADGRYRYDDNQGDLRDSSEFGDWLVTAGIAIAIGGRAAAAAPVTRTYELSADALFAFNKSNLSSQGVTTINTFASDLGRSSYTAVRVAGHTDPIGSDAFNQALSERRAGTVQDQLVTQGVPANQITAVGYGESQLKVTEAECAGAKSRAALIDCLQPNRRVEVTVEGMTEKK